MMRTEFRLVLLTMIRMETNVVGRLRKTPIWETAHDTDRGDETIDARVQGGTRWLVMRLAA